MLWREERLVFWRTVSLVIGLLAMLAVACGGGGAWSPAPTQDPAAVASAPECSPKDETIYLSDSPEVRLDCNEAALGQRITVRLLKWHPGAAKLYLLTEDQIDKVGADFRNQDPVYLGIVSLQSGQGTFQFVLAKHFDTAEGHDLVISPGDKLDVFALQGSYRGSTGSGTGLTVR
jgi:hypothetical protein